MHRVVVVAVPPVTSFDLFIPETILSNARDRRLARRTRSRMRTGELDRQHVHGRDLDLLLDRQRARSRSTKGCVPSPPPTR